MLRFAYKTLVARLWLLLLLMLVGLPALAVPYTFSPTGFLPAGCSLNAGSTSAYTCGAMTFAAGDTVTIGAIKPISITVNGAVTTGPGVLINAAGAPSELSLMVNGAVTLGAGSNLNANTVTLGAGSVTIGANSWIGGNLSTETGFVVIGAATVPPPAPPTPQQTGVGGNVSTVTGYISMGAYSVITGTATTQSTGYVLLGANAKVSGPISTLGAGYVVLGANSQVGGSITVSGTTGADYVSVGVNSVITGNISTAGSYITLGANTQVSGNVSTKLSYISVGAVCVIGGQVAMNDPAPSYIVIGDGSKVYAVCCNGKDANCVTNNSTEVPAPLVCKAPVSPVASFECFETGLAYNNLTATPAARNPLYTKLATSNFTLDVAVLKVDGALETNYVATGVKVELVEGAGTTACANRAAISPAILQTLSFSSTDAGRKSTANITVNKAYANLRCRVTDASQSTPLVACSTDNFSVRPATVTLMTAASAPAATATAAPVIKAGASFGLSASTTASNTISDGYAGILYQDTSKLSAQTISQDSSPQSGGVVGTLSPTSLLANASSTSGTYSEAGFVYLAAGAYRDEAFTLVDSAVGDCITDTSHDHNLADTLIGNKYGCHIGNKATVSLGRFIPDHFETALSQGCSTFTYAGQPLASLSLSAYSAGGTANAGLTKNYAGVYAKALTLSDANAVTGGGFSLANIAAGAFVSGVYTNNALSYAFTSPAHVPATIKLRAVEPSDGVSSMQASPLVSVEGVSEIRSGRVRLVNNFGSELLDLPMSMTAQYWKDSASGWQLNAADTCTNPSLSFSAVATPDISANTCVWDSGLASGNSGKGCSIAASAKQYKEVGVSGFAGDFNLWLKSPGSGATGSIDVTASVPAWLQYNWTGVVGNPKARASFGVYKSKSNKVIRRLEIY